MENAQHFNAYMIALADEQCQLQSIPTNEYASFSVPFVHLNDKPHFTNVHLFIVYMGIFYE